MPTNFIWLTPEEAVEKGLYDSLDAAEAVAQDDRLCDCGQHAWRYGGAGLCFPCMTGESDASDDYEVGVPY